MEIMLITAVAGYHDAGKARLLSLGRRCVSADAMIKRFTFASSTGLDQQAGFALRARIAACIVLPLQASTSSS